MNKVIVMFSAAALMMSCSNQQVSETSEQAAIITDSVGTTYQVDTNVSTVAWTAEKIVGSHNGAVKINGGSFVLNNGNIVSGGFTIDMNSINNIDITDVKYNTDLVNHLKSPDFFNAGAFPNAKFEITASEILEKDPNGYTHMISGNLSIKDSVKNISFPVKISSNGDELSAEGSAVINRLQWGLVYNSVSVSPAALLKKLGDNAIKDELKLGINLKAKKG